MSSVVLLGAGLGARLRPHTDDRPKCVVELAGEPLAVRLLRQLAERGVTHATVVVGHFAPRAIELIRDGLQRRGVKLAVRFVENRQYDRTNTMYSLLLAMDALASGGFVVEGDIIASEPVLDALVAAARQRGGRSRWAVDAWTPAHSGSRLTDDGHGRIVRQEIWRAATTGDTAHLWKSAGMLWLSADDARALALALDQAASAGQRNVYYDDVIGQLLARGDDGFAIHTLDLAGAPWMEIDDASDLAAARALFEAPLREAI